MQWDNAPNGGFSPAGAQTWLPVNPNYARGVNVADQLDDPGSLLNFYRRMLRVRKQTPALIAGDYTVLHEEAEDYLAFLRSIPPLSSPPLGGREGGDGQTCLVVLNISDQAHTLRFDGSTEASTVSSAEPLKVLDAHTARLIFSSQTREGDTDNLSQLTIAPFEVYIGEIVRET
jgi:alpha-glucosidase